MDIYDIKITFQIIRANMDLFFDNWLGIWKMIKLDLFLKPHTRINSKWIKAMNEIGEIIKLLEKIGPFP